jgi:predicted TIM-barrel fold metal-dependent hydrolase
MVAIREKTIVISSDSHVNEPAELWAERLPADLRHRAPHREQIDGVEYLVVEGARPRKMAGGRIAFEGEEMEREQAGGWDPAFRVRDQERDGVSAEVVFPTNGLNVFISPDPEFQMAMARAYNDWAHDIFGPYRDRLAPAALVPVGSIELAIAEVDRVARLGFRTVFLPAQVENRPYNLPDYDPLWAAIQETGLPVSIHVGSGHEPRGERGAGGPIINYVLHAQGDGPRVSAYLCCGGVLKRFPNLKFAMVESGAAWLAWIMNAMDEAYKKHHMWIRDFEKLDMRPSDYFKRQGHAGFMYDPPAVANRHFTGVGTLLWGNDYPHHEGTWPRSQEALAQQFAGVPEDETRRIIGGTAAALYGFPIGDA